MAMVLFADRACLKRSRKYQLLIGCALALCIGNCAAKEVSDQVGAGSVLGIGDAPVHEPNSPFWVVNRNRNSPPEFGWLFLLSGKLGTADYLEMMVPRERGQQELRRFVDAASYLPKQVTGSEWRLIRVFGGEPATVSFEQRIHDSPVEASRITISEGVVTRMSLYAADPSDPRFHPDAWLPKEVLFDLAETQINNANHSATKGLQASDCPKTRAWRGKAGYPKCTLNYKIILKIQPDKQHAAFMPVMHYNRDGYRCEINALSGEVHRCTSVAVH